MGKRSNFERKERDFYPTPYSAVIPLLPFLAPETRFIEPCAGDGRLIGHLAKHGHRCVYSCDIEPMAPGIECQDVLWFGTTLPPAEAIITNPPWDREPLHAMIDKFRNHAPTWLLFDADWMFTKQSLPFKKYCRKIVGVGRVSWMMNDVGGKENACWYLFDREPCETIFI